jgi:hypothetical protein
MIALLSGCASPVKQQDAATFETYLNAGDYRAAATAATAAGQIQQDGKTENVVWSLNAGATLFDVGDMKTAIADLDTVEKLAQSNDLNQIHAAFDYQYTTYDGVMTNVYKAMAFLALGDRDNARVEFNRAEDRQKRAEEYFQKEVARASAHNQVANDNQFAGLMQSAQQNQDYAQTSAELGKLAVYTPFENPFATYLAGIVFTAQGDVPKGLDRLKRASDVLGPNSPANADLLWAQQQTGTATQPGASTSKSGHPQVWVIFENGQSSTFHEMHLSMPMITGKPLTLALPILVQNALAYSTLRISAEGAATQTVPAGSFDAVMASEFNRRQSLILAEAVAEVLVKNAASVAAQKSNNSLLNAVVGIAANVSTADTRSWTALPKQFQAARLATPADGHVLLASPDGATVGEANVPLDRSSIVWVKIQHVGAHPAVQVIPL